MDLFVCWDEIFGFYLNLIVEIVLKIVVGSDIVFSIWDVFLDIFYGFCLCYVWYCEVVLKVVVNSFNFFFKMGILIEFVKSIFVVVVVC